MSRLGFYLAQTDIEFLVLPRELHVGVVSSAVVFITQHLSL